MNTSQVLRTLAKAVPLTGVLERRHSRIFVARKVRPDATASQPGALERDALRETLKLAQAASATVNLTYWGQGPYAAKRDLEALQWPFPTVTDWPQPGKRKWPVELTGGQLTEPAEHMRRFARVVQLARADWQCPCAIHATVQNEVNEPRVDIAKKRNPGLSMRFYEWLYRLFDQSLKDFGIRGAVKIIGGDLVEKGHGTQDAWLTYMRRNMDVPREGFTSVLDGYSIHVYWQPGGGANGFPAKLERRLTNLVRTMNTLGIDKPLYVTEYGVMKPVPGKPLPGGVGSGQKIEFSPDVAFQHAWFNALAPQHGCAGLAKWVLYRTDERAAWGEWGMLDAPNAAPAPRTPFGRSPTYRMTRLFNHLVEPKWKAAGLGRGAGNLVLASKFVGPANESVAVLNRDLRPRQVRVVGLTPGRRYFAADWNRDGEGGLHPLDPLTADAGRSVTVSVPSRGVVGLSTRPLGL